jgi:hypothetical protein
MTTGVWLGIFSIGFVFGYLLFYSVRHTKEFNVDLLSSAIGAVGGGAVIKFVGGADGWLGPYGIGIGSGFILYGILCLVLIGPGAPTFAKETTGQERLKSVTQSLLGKPRAE